MSANLGEKLTDEEIDELLEEVGVGKDDHIKYVAKCSIHLLSA